MSDHTVRRILHEDLNFHRYKMVMVQAINDQDTVNWKTVCEVLLNTLNNDNLNHILMMDEANFHLCGNISSQNCRYWAAENPCDIHQKPLHSEKIIVWCGVASLGWSAPISLKTSALQWDASHISGTRVAETWCWNPDCLVSARRGNGSHCEDCSASHQRDVPSLHDLTKRGNWMACKIIQSQCLWLLPLGISQEQGVWKETKNNGGLETEHQGQNGSNFSHHAATSGAELPETLEGICWQQVMPPHRHYIQKVNIVIKMLWDKDNFSNKFT